MRRPANLSPKANREINAILRRSAREYGLEHASELRKRLYARCIEVAEGHDHGHSRQDLPEDLPLRFIFSRPFMIAYDPTTRMIDSILDGRRDFRTLFRRDRDES